MITVENTPNNLGVTISGDQHDFDRLYDALHAVVADETYAPSARLRVLGICYDIRHALMGNRDYTFVPNGLTDEIKKYQAIMAPDKNVYLRINVLWPELLFIQFALNMFSERYVKSLAKNAYMSEYYTHPKVIWDETFAQVRLFQAAIATGIQNTVSDTSYRRMVNIMTRYDWRAYAYFTQYIDVLNDKFIAMTPEKRLKNITIMAKRIAEPNDDYRQLEKEVSQAALKYNCSTDEIRLDIEYPEHLEW